MKRSGFTLLELLAVIAVMILLASLILTGLNAARERARVMQARNDIQQIQLAWNAYLADYHRFPFDGSGVIVVDSGPIMQALRGRNSNDSEWVSEYRAMNPRGITYFEIHHTTTEVLDPWGNRYGMAFDLSNSGEVSVGGETVRGHVAVWSMGPDGLAETRDDVRGWRSEL